MQSLVVGVYKVSNFLSSKLLWHIIDALWLLVLMLYVLAGTPLVPFHGDESTIISMSKDYAYIFQENQLDYVRYSDPPLVPAEQQPRLITGALVKYLIGLSWDINGYSESDLNEQWHWDFDWDWNVSNGHMPDDTLLMLGRWPSAIMLALSVGVLFAIGYLLGGRGVAYLASSYYTFNPVVLLSGRRAMFEGGLFLFTGLIVLFSLLYLRRPRTWKALALGVSFGLAIAMKHTAIVTVLAIILATFGYTWTRNQHGLKRVTLHLTMAALVGLAVSYALQPVWWGNPFVRLPQIIEARSDLLAGQIGAFGGYESFTDRITGFARQVFTGNPQYYEVEEWSNYIADQIANYEVTIWAGVTFHGSLATIVIIAFSCIGLWVLFTERAMPEYARWITGIWSLVTLVSLPLVTPLEWQRYYLPAFPVIALLIAIGFKFVFVMFSSRLRKSPNATLNGEPEVHQKAAAELSDH